MGKISIRVFKETGGHFWHWFIGEFLPFADAVRRLHKIDEVAIVRVFHPSRVWGLFPLDRFFTDLESSDIIISLGSTPLVETRIEMIHEKSWDHSSRLPWGKHMTSRIKKTVNWIKSRSGTYCSDISPRLVVQTREESTILKQFYASTTFKPYGASRRNIRNLSEFGEELKQQGYPVDIVNRDGMGLFEQMAPYQKASHLILCHGAGMVWGLFLKGDGEILELQSKTGNWGKAICQIGKLTNSKVTKLHPIDNSSTSDIHLLQRQKEFVRFMRRLSRRI